MVAAGLLNWQLLLAAIIAHPKADQAPLLAPVSHSQPLLPGNKAAMKRGAIAAGERTAAELTADACFVDPEAEDATIYLCRLTLIHEAVTPTLSSNRMVKGRVSEREASSSQGTLAGGAPTKVDGLSGGATASPGDRPGK
jgi:hypothetical protein